MTYDIVLRNGRLVNEGEETQEDLWIKDGCIAHIGSLSADANEDIDVDGMVVMPGVIDDQVHFREPGLTHKANIYTESRGCLVGGITSYMEMPNTKPPALTQKGLAEKYDIARESSWANYSFYMGVSNDNIEEVLKTDRKSVCGVKVFMGSSTGNMLVDNETTLRNIFKNCPMLIATHCEDEDTIKTNTEAFVAKFGADQLSAAHHPQIRDRQGCLKSSTMAVELAKACDARLHVLHISTADELALFEPGNRKSKRITAEACVHHLTFSDEDYATLGNRVKCNPAIKTSADRDAIRAALLDGRIDVIATDHAPHTSEEKSMPYIQAPSGLPLVQHSLHLMLQGVHDGWLSMTQLVDLMCHASAELFDIEGRGFLREGYHADIVVVDPTADYVVDDHRLWAMCGWTPLVGRTLKGRVLQTILNGRVVYADGRGIIGHPSGARLTFA